MKRYSNRVMVTMLSEWEPIFDKLKKEKFFNSSRAEMLRYVISRGLELMDDDGRQEKEVLNSTVQMGDSGERGDKP